MKLKMVLIIGLILALSSCSAMLINLPKYTIDTGLFVVPNSAKMPNPESINGTYYEGFVWDVGVEKHSMITIAECSETVDPRAIQYNMMKYALCNNSQYLNNSEAYAPVEKPYPGWVSYCQWRNFQMPLMTYAGSVDDKTVLFYATTTDADKAMSILEGFRVMLRDNESNLSFINQSTHENISKYFV